MPYYRSLSVIYFVYGSVYIIHPLLIPQMFNEYQLSATNQIGIRNQMRSSPCPEESP